MYTCKLPPIKVPCKTNPHDKRIHTKSCPEELIRNGNFEIQGTVDSFAYWQQEGELNIIPFAQASYEGVLSAAFISFPTTVVETKTGRLFQHVPVPPCSFLSLSFAENFFRKGTDFADLSIRVRVFYQTNNPVDLINVGINYRSFEEPTGGFVYHQNIADIPVPPHVSDVTVEFFVSITDFNPLETIWLLDGVSLRAVAIK